MVLVFKSSRTDALWEFIDSRTCTRLRIQQTLLATKKTMGDLTQKRADEIFRDINIIVNGFYTMNWLAYWSLRIGGFVAWNGHRKRNVKIPGIK